MTNNQRKYFPSTIYLSRTFVRLYDILGGEKLKRVYFYADEPLQKRLKSIQEGERSCIIRIALRDYFKLTDSKNGKVGYETIDDIETAIERRSE